MNSKRNDTKHKAALFPGMKAIDLLVILFCLAGTGISLNFFRLDLFQTIRGLTDTPVGIITFKYNTAQRRLANRMLWDRLRQESPLYQGDIIRTANLSEAMIHLSGGGEINMGENTLIQITLQNGKTRIELSEGALSLASGNSAAAASGLVLSAGGRQVELSSGTVLSAATAAAGLSVQVAEGNAQIGGQNMAAGSALTLDGSGEAVPEPAVVVGHPRPNARFINPQRGALEIVFSWSRANLPPDEPLLLEIAADRGFAKIDQTVESTGSAAAVLLPPGTWYWRIQTRERAAGGAPLTLSTGRLIVVYTPTPAALTPAEAYEYRYRTRQPQIRFQWTETPEAAYYLFEAGQRADLSNPQISTQARGGASLVSSAFGAGTWYWRVRPVFPGEYEGSALPSATASFRIEQGGTLEAPLPVNPEAGGVVNIARDRGDYHFSWRQRAEAVSYTIRIAANKDMQNPVISASVRDNFYTYRKNDRTLRPGQYYWAVSQTDTEGNESPFSPARAFAAVEGEIIQRAIFPPDGYVIAGALLPDVRFTWKSNVPFETRFQVSDTADFSRLQVDDKVTGESWQMRALPPGGWYWRIYAHSGGADGIQFGTPPRRFVSTAAFPAPVLTEPAASGWMVLRENEQAQFRWQPVSGADYYQLRLYMEKDRNRPVYERNLLENAWHPVSMDTLPEGVYYWTVQGFAAESQLSTRQTGRIGGELFSLRKLRPLDLESPETGTVIEGLSALRNATVLRWSSPEAVENSRFVLSRNPNPTEGTPVREIANPARAVSLTRLNEGLYYWTVLARTLDGFDISPRTPRSFRILPIPLLPAAGNRLPAAGYIIGPEELSQNRNIVFRWDEVEGADAYIFTLFRKTPNGRQQVFRSAPEKTSSWTLEGMELLDRGDFVWQVEAVSLGNGNLVEQHGQPGENTFAVDIPRPRRVRARDTGILYGR